MSVASAVLSIDQGTTGSRALVFTSDGRLLASSYEEFAQYFPHPGWVEHNAEEIWLSVESTVRQALCEAGLGAGELGAIGITNQRETTVLWDRETASIVNNESAELLRILNSSFESCGSSGPDFYPLALRDEIDKVNDPIAVAVP